MHLSVFMVFFFVVGHEGLHVHGPSGPVVAQLGGSVLLPCFTEIPLPLEGLQVEWRKKDSDSLVSLFQQGKSRPDLQSQVFKGRVDFFPNKVLKGNFSILLKNVVEEDAGGYRCKVNTSEDSSEVIMEVKNIRGLVVTGSDQAVFASEGKDVILNCSVDSHVPASEIEEVTWKRTDRDPEILVLLYQDSEIFPDSSHESYQDRVDLFPSEIPKGNFSLNLKHVKMEDKGEFTCEVHTRNMSGRTTVLLQGVGFAALHIAILVLCSVALLLAVGFCGPVFNLLRKKVASKEGMKWQIFLILCPNICMFLSFCLWSLEGFLSEVIVCLTVSIMRPVILMKTSSYLGMLPERLQKAVKALAVPLYHISITIAACSFFFGNLTRVQAASKHIVTVIVIVEVVIAICAFVLAILSFETHLTMCLEIFNLALVGTLLSSSAVNFDYSFEVPSVISPQIMGIMMVLILQGHLFQWIPFERLHIALSSVFVTVLSLGVISIYILLSITLKNFAKGWILLSEGVMYIVVWSGVIYLLRRQQGQRQGCCSQWRKTGYLCCAVIITILMISIAAFSFHYLYAIMEDEDRSGYLALIPLVHVLTAICLFRHPKYLPDFLHVMIYMFGAVGLSSINAIVLATELILKAGKGLRTLGDLRVVVLPLETLYFSAWLALQIYDFWKRLKNRAKQGFEMETRTGAEIVPEMEALSVPKP
ncbi:uncharacterized protein LOC131351013 [Hemibagrus wyckioides]|uniref:uncharacterized protein LOC131351013 n=1 Tax=Hemibagrus wyckioides TaxID=337641 RepID=UPI00266C166A|nr:uncharacterized protein LOC131351013 [Hemibagrus wyckioides]